MSYTTKLTLPTIRNIREAQAICHDYDAVITAGPTLSEVSGFNHPNHKVVSFADTIVESAYGRAPSFEDVRELITWGEGKDNLLVHCHAGISRSTATAWGISIANGTDPEEAIRNLIANHPVEDGYFGRAHKRPFYPNQLIVKHLEKMFGFKQHQLLKLINQYGIDF